MYDYNSIINNIFKQNKVPLNIQNQIIYLSKQVISNMANINPSNFKPTFSKKAISNLNYMKNIQNKYKSKVKILSLFNIIYIYDLNNKLIDKIENYYNGDPYRSDPATSGTISNSSGLQGFLATIGIGFISYALIASLPGMLIFGFVLIVIAGLLALLQSAASSVTTDDAVQVINSQGALVVNTVSSFKDNKINQLIIDDKGKSGVFKNVGHIVISPIITNSDIINQFITFNSQPNRDKCKDIPCNIEILGIKPFANDPCCINYYSREQPVPEPEIENIESNQNCQTFCDRNYRVIECRDINTNEIIHRQSFQDNPGCCSVQCNQSTNTWFERCGNINPTNTNTRQPCSQPYKI